jgi:hypothetical protein
MIDDLAVTRDDRDETGRRASLETCQINDLQLEGV